METVLNPAGSAIALSEAVKVKSMRSWRCALCKEPVHIRTVRGTPVMAHIEGGCSGRVEAFKTAQVAHRAAALLAQNGYLCVPVPGSDKVTKFAHWMDSGRELTNLPGAGLQRIPLERIQAFSFANSTVPLVLVQSYWTSFLIGFNDGPQGLEELSQLGAMMEVGILAVPVHDAFTAPWDELTQNLLNEGAENSRWAADCEDERLNEKRGKFKRLSRLNALTAAVWSNRKATHYEPRDLRNRLQYLQDITDELRAQRWPRWVNRLVLRKDQKTRWSSWFEGPGLQVPYFWLRFWLIKNGLHTKGRLLDCCMLAMELQGSMSLEPDNQLLLDLQDAFKDILQELMEKQLVAEKGGEFYCVKSLR